MHVVIDLETLSLKPNAVILSVGAVAENGEQFYVELDWRDQERHRKVDADTCLWWGQQEKDLCPLNGTTLLTEGLFDLSQWLLPYDKDNLFIWVRGPQFDIVILENAFDDARIPVPWKYKNVRDVRTALHCKGLSFVDYNPIRKHHALDDAIADMKNLSLRGLTTYDLSKP